MMTLSRMRYAIGVMGVAACVSLRASAAAPHFYDDDPIRVDRDTEDASGLAKVEVDLFVDLAYNFLTAGRDEADRPAGDVNTIDEVPDSSWYTNRLGDGRLRAADVTRGPDTTDGPAPGPWTITTSKSDGVTPGFTIRDTAGRLWFLKFDPPGYRAMATGTEVTVTKLLWALGFNVPENHIAYVRREQLVLADAATFTPAGGDRRPMRGTDVDHLLARADREPDGSFRVVASRALAGKPVGRIRFVGTRPDDPNDIVAHEDRRELRGYGVFAAWLNHVDAKAINSLDTLVTEGGRTFVRHHLLDFGSSLGSGGVAPADYWGGTGYLLEPHQVARRILGLGLAVPDWQRRPFYESPAIGRLPLDNTHFEPDGWKPRVPNQAFLHARADDKFWAARKLAAITDDMLWAAVRAGEFGDPAAEAFLVRFLAERRDAIARAYLPAINPIVDPRLDDEGRLAFRNAAVDAGVAAPPAGYRAAWSSFDNTTGRTEPIGITSGPGTVLPVPEALVCTPGEFVRVDLSSVGSARPAWRAPETVYFRLTVDGWQLVALTRSAAAQ
jgi:hypothetical protein